MEPSKINVNPTVSLSRRDFTPDLVDETASWLAKVLRNSTLHEQQVGEDVVEEDEEVTTTREPVTAGEVYELIKDIRDPEHPLSLSQLNVVKNDDSIQVDDDKSRVVLYFTPTVPHCSMSTLIGLCLRVKLLRSLPPRFKVDIYVEPGSHSSELQVNKQLNDKERVAAALENGQLLAVVNKCLA